MSQCENGAVLCAEGGFAEMVGRFLLSEDDSWPSLQGDTQRYMSAALSLFKVTLSDHACVSQAG